jgi:hypothetical protein
MTADLEQRIRAIVAVAHVQAMPHRLAGQSDRLAHQNIAKGPAPCHSTCALHACRRVRHSCRADGNLDTRPPRSGPSSDLVPRGPHRALHRKAGCSLSPLAWVSHRAYAIFGLIVIEWGIGSFAVTTFWNFPGRFSVGDRKRAAADWDPGIGDPGSWDALK